MSASVADPRLQNWFINSSYDNDQLTYNSYTQSNTQSNPNNNNNNHDINTHKIMPSHSKHPTSQLFGTSIFGDTHYTNTISSPLIPTQHISTYNTPPTTPPPTHIHLPNSDTNNSNKHISQPQPQANEPITHIKHLITTLSYTIQQMNQYLDVLNIDGNNQLCKGLNAKTTNCRNEMVSALSYYQTYIESIPSHSLSPISLQMDDMSLLQQNHCSKSPSHSYCPLNQGLEFPRMAYATPQHSQTHMSDAKLIALDVVGHIIGTPGPMNDDTPIHTRTQQQPTHTHSHSNTPTHPSPIRPITPPYQITNANSQSYANPADHGNTNNSKSRLNAYAQPYQSPYNSAIRPHHTQTHIQSQSPLHLNITPKTNDTIRTQTQTQTQHTAIQQYYNTLAAQQRAAKITQYNNNIPLHNTNKNNTPQNRINHSDGKEKENTMDGVLTDNDDMAKSNSIETNHNDKEDESQEIIQYTTDHCDAQDHNQTQAKNININQSQHINNSVHTKKTSANKSQARKNINKPPLWSAIAKQIVKPTPTPIPIISHEEKSVEEIQKNVRNGNNNNYWNVRRMNNYNGSISSSSTSSKSDRNRNNNQSIITPSPSPPNNNNRMHNNFNMRRNHRMNDNNTERCRVFVSNLPPNVTDQDIRNAFAHCGGIANTVWFPSRTDGKFYGSGLITFVDADGSRDALRMNQQNVLGRIIRCEYSSGQDPVKVKPPGCRTIYLNNVPRDAQESRIREVFKYCGKIKRVRFHERDTKRTGGAFVEFENTVSCDKALDLHGKIVDNHPLYVDYQRY